MKNFADETCVNKKETNIVIGWLHHSNLTQIDKRIVNINEFGKDFVYKLNFYEKALEYLKVNEDSVKLFTDDFMDGIEKLTGRKNIENIRKETSDLL